MDDNVIIMGARQAQHSQPPLLPLRLDAQSMPSDQDDPERRVQRLKALDRDGNTCRFCGFRAPKWQEVHHLSGDHRDDQSGNLATACTLCHAAQHLGAVGRAGGGMLIWLPEMSQAELHHAVRGCWVMRQWADGMAADRRNRPDRIAGARSAADATDRFMVTLSGRAARVHDLLSSSDPGILASALRFLTDGLRARSEEMLHGIRLLPFTAAPMVPRARHQDMVASWLEHGGPYSGASPQTWVSLARQYGMLP